MQIIKLNNVGRKFHNFINANVALNKNKAIMNAVSKEGAFWAIRNIDMSIDNGEIIGVIGRNGSGKSTLLSIIAGILPISEGEAMVNGKISALLSLGTGFQDEFTGRENIYFNATLLGMKKAEIEAKFMSIVEWSELGDFINAPLGSYSAGMKMRLGFSIVVHKEFDILLIDEIITVGDLSFRKKCFERMADFKRQGKSMVIATQDIGIVERFCGRVFLLEDGKIFATGPSQEVVEQYQMLLNKKKILSEGSRADIIETNRPVKNLQE